MVVEARNAEDLRSYYDRALSLCAGERGGELDVGADRWSFAARQWVAGSHVMVYYVVPSFLRVGVAPL